MRISFALLFLIAFLFNPINLGNNVSGINCSNDLMLDNQFFEITNINSSTVWRSIQSNIFEWNALDSDIGHVDIILLVNGTEELTLVSNSLNDGYESFFFYLYVEPGENLISGTGYTLTIRDSSNHNNYVNSTSFTYYKNWVEYIDGINDGERKKEKSSFSLTFKSYSKSGLKLSLFNGNEYVKTFSPYYSSTSGVYDYMSILPEVYDGVNYRIKLSTADMYVFTPYFSIYGDAAFTDFEINSEIDEGFIQWVKPGHAYRFKWNTTGEIDEVYISNPVNETVENIGYFDWKVPHDFVNKTLLTIESKLHWISRGYIFYLIPDNTIPVLYIDPTPISQGSDQYYELLAYDETPMQYAVWLDGEIILNGSLKNNTAIKIGFPTDLIKSYNLTVFIIDYYNNSITKEFTVEIIDDISPTISLPQVVTFEPNHYRISWNVKDRNLYNFSIWIDSELFDSGFFNNNNSLIEMNITVTSLVTTIFKIKVWDKFGNFMEREDEINFTYEDIDTHETTHATTQETTQEMDNSQTSTISELIIRFYVFPLIIFAWTIIRIRQYIKM